MVRGLNIINRQIFIKHLVGLDSMMHVFPNIEYFQFIKIFMRSAAQAGKEVLSIYNEDDYDVKLKGDNSPLTRADIASHQIIKEKLTSAFPNLPLMSEEGKDIPYEERSTWDKYICIDPLDGTKEFIKKNGEFTLNLALIKKNKAIVGLIYIPVKDILYFGGKEIGAYRVEDFSSINIESESLIVPQENIHQLPLRDLANDTLTIVGSRSHMNEETKQFIKDLKIKYKNINFISAGSSLKLCLIAEGTADIYPRFAPTMEWDTAAGQAIVEGAGGKVVVYGKGTPMIYNKDNIVNPWFIAMSLSS